jgi:hypothetical protein
MAKNKSPDHRPIRPKVFVSQEEILQGIAKLQGRLAQVEELGKGGLPYRDALRVAIEAQVRETIREIFGEHSPEFREHQHHRIKSHAEENLAETCAMLQSLIENLDEQQRHLFGGATPAAPTARSQTSARATDPAPARPASPAVPPQQPSLSAPGNPPQPSSRPVKEGADIPAASAAAHVAELHPLRAQAPPAADPLGRIKKICLRFHAVVRQLRQRHDARPTLEVEDLHDVRDLLHALLCLEFEDIRMERWALTSADGQDRTDLMIERERIAIMVKRTRQGFGAKEIAEQLAADFQRYATHPNCKTLLCFIYDPEGRIGNPRGLEAELKRERGGQILDILVAPQ